MKRYISGKPTFYLRQIFPKNKGRLDVFPLNQKRCFYFFSARYALAAAIEAFGLQPGNKILVPSYNCGTELDPLLHFNIEPVFYKINKDLSVDFEDLSTKLTDGVRAVLVTHFLGFPQSIDEIKKICSKRELFLIEDCAHALLSSYKGEPLGSYGDISIFSLLKTLPVPNGGVLLLNNGNLICDKDLQEPNPFCAVFYITELLRRKTRGYDHTTKELFVRVAENSFCIPAFSLKILVAIFRKLFNINSLSLVRPDSYLFEENVSSWGMSFISKNIINATNFEEIKKIRRRNFRYLLDHFRKNRRQILVFDELPASVCPLFFPTIVETNKKRELLHKILRLKGITTHPWWNRFHPEVPWEAFPDAVYLKQRLLGLPIHQDLELKHLDEVIREFENVYQSLER